MFLGVALLAVGLSSWTPRPAGVWHDDGVYILVGQTLAQGGGLAYGGVVGAPPATKFPPFYPALAALASAAASDVTGRVRVVAAINVLLMALAGVMFALLCHRALGLRVRIAVLLSFLTWMSVDLWRVSVIPLSEPLFVASLMAALVACRWTVPVTHSASVPLWPLLMGVAVVTHVRSVGIALAGAAVVLALGQRQWRRAGVLGASVGAILSPWWIWAGRGTARIPEGLADVLGGYGSFMQDRLQAGLFDFLLALPARALGLVDWCLAVLLPGSPSGWRWALGILLLPVLILGWLDLYRRYRLAALTFGLLLVAVWFWPFVDRRLMAPLVPWLALCLFLGGAATSRSLPGPLDPDLLRHWRSPRALPSLLVSLWALGFGLVSVVGLARGWHDAAYDVRAAAVVEAIHEVDRATDPDEVVGAPELWAALHLYTGRTVAPSAPFRPGDPNRPVWGSPDEQIRLWSAAGLDVVLLEHGGRVHGPTLERIESVCGSETTEEIGRYAGAVLVRLRWDRDCRRALLGTG